MPQEHYVDFYKNLMRVHLSFSMASILFFFFALTLVKNNKLHVRFATAYIFFLILATLSGFLIAGLSLSDTNFLHLGNNNASQFLSAFRSLDITHFGYIVSVQRGLIVLLMCTHVLQLQNVISSAAFKNLRMVLGLFFLLTFYFYKNIWLYGLWPYHVSNLVLLASVACLYFTALRLEKSMQHAAFAVFSFLIFIETGLLGGVGQLIPWLQTKNIMLFTIIRLMPLILTLIFIYFRLHRKKRKN